MARAEYSVSDGVRRTINSTILTVQSAVRPAKAFTLKVLERHAHFCESADALLYLIVRDIAFRWAQGCEQVARYDKKKHPKVLRAYLIFDGFRE